jgi:hypothetical protein
MKKLAIILIGALFVVSVAWLEAHAAPATCSITGVVNDAAGSAVANATIYFNSLNTQIISGTAIAPVLKSATTDASGNISSIALVQGLFLQVTICQAGGAGCGAPQTGFIPQISTTTFANILSGTLSPVATNLTGNLNASGFRITNLGANTTSGDALSQGVSHLGDLATNNANYNFGGFKFTNMGAGTVSGDSMAFGLNHLNDLATATGNYSMGSNRLTSVLAPTTTGDALSEGRAVGGITPAVGTFTGLAITQLFQGSQQTLAESGGGTLTPNFASAGPDFLITLADNSAWTLANPSNLILSAGLVFHWWIRIVNNSGGAAGTITLGGQYRTDTSWSSTGPANAKTRICPVYSVNGPVHYIGPCTADETN